MKRKQSLYMFRGLDLGQHAGTPVRRVESRTKNVNDRQTSPRLFTFLSPYIQPSLLLAALTLTAVIPVRPAIGKDPAASTEPAGLPDRNWKQHPAIVEMDSVTDLCAVGDAHGDYDRLPELLAAAKLITGVPANPEAVKWAGGRAVLVCTGDLIDKYPHSMPVIALMRTMQADAEKSGGRVIVTLGNHEAEFLGGGGEDKKGAEFEAELNVAGLSPEAVAAGRDSAGIGAWLRGLPAGAKVGDWFFCHAGNTGGKTLDDLRGELEKQITEAGFSTPILSDPNSMLQARMHPRPWWDAGNDPGLKDTEKEGKKLKGGKSSKPPARSDEAAAESSEQRLHAIVGPLGAKHLVIGHQPGKVTFADGTVREQGEMFTKFNGLFFMLDTGMSRGVDGGRGAVLRISGGKAIAVYADGKREVLWE